MTVVLLKTHIWNEYIENFCIKIFDETFPDIDFFILMVSDTNVVINEKLQPFFIFIHEDEIKNLYSIGFFNIWLSNHWILMWFFQNYKKYDYYWTVEYDVRIKGDSRKIWNYYSNIDFLYPRGNVHNPKADYFNYYEGNKLKFEDKRTGFLQLARYSIKLLNYLNECFLEENGQDELIIFSLVKRGNFTLSNFFLGSLIKGKWCADSNSSKYNKKIYNNIKCLSIFHPIK